MRCRSGAGSAAQPLVGPGGRACRLSASLNMFQHWDILCCVAIWSKLTCLMTSSKFQLLLNGCRKLPEKVLGVWDGSVRIQRARDGYIQCYCEFPGKSWHEACLNSQSLGNLNITCLNVANIFVVFRRASSFTLLCLLLPAVILFTDLFCIGYRGGGCWAIGTWLSRHCCCWRGNVDQPG